MEGRGGLSPPKQYKKTRREGGRPLGFRVTLGFRYRNWSTIAANATKNSRYLSTAPTIQHAIPAADEQILPGPAGRTDDQPARACVDHTRTRTAAQHGLTRQPTHRPLRCGQAPAYRSNAMHAIHPTVCCCRRRATHRASHSVRHGGGAVRQRPVRRPAAHSPSQRYARVRRQVLPWQRWVKT